MNNINSEHWSEYWSQGHTTSFGNTFSNGYKGIIKNTWEAYFSSLKANSRVLDLCTGNASLLRLAKASLNGDAGIDFTGVDYANIEAKDGFDSQKNIHLSFGVNIEQLPFTDESFNYVISNFGIEYSELSKSIAEASRVLVSGGKLELVCHCFDSVLIKSNAQELKMLSQMLSPNNVLENLQDLIDALAERDQTRAQQTVAQQNSFKLASEKAERCRHQLNDNIGKVANTFTEAFQGSDFLGFLKYLLGQQSGDKKQVLNSFKLDLQSHSARLNSMVTAALSQEQIARLAGLFSDNRLAKLSLNAVEDEQGKIACRISAVKV